MASEGPEGWQALIDGLAKYGFPGGVIVGAIGLAVSIKRGWLFIGDRTKLAVLLAVAEKENEHKSARIAELEGQLAEAQSMLAKSAADT